MDPLMQVLEDGVARGGAPAVAAACATRDGVSFCGAAGQRCVASGDSLRTDAIFRIASMTKAVTSVAALQLVESEQVGLDDQMSRFLPELADRPVIEGLDGAGQAQLRPAAGPISLRQLLTHTAGFGYWFLDPRLFCCVERGIVGDVLAGTDEFLNAPLVRDPGSAWEYGINTDWVGRLVEVLSGQRLGDYCRERIFEPLEMVETSFDLSAEAGRRVVTIHRRGPDDSLVEDPDAPPPPVSFHQGGGGLYSTAGDYLRFLQALLRGGELGGRRILGEAMVAEASRDQIAPLRVEPFKTADPALCNDVDAFAGGQYGLGFLINPQPLPTGRSAGSLAWAGLYNSYYWIDPSRGVAGVYLSQILPFYDPGSVAVSQAFEAAVYQTL